MASVLHAALGPGFGRAPWCTCPQLGPGTWSPASSVGTQLPSASAANPCLTWLPQCADGSGGLGTPWARPASLALLCLLFTPHGPVGSGPCEAACAAPRPLRLAQPPLARPLALASPAPSVCLTGPPGSHAGLWGAAALVRGHPERLSDVCCPHSQWALCPVFLGSLGPRKQLQTWFCGFGLTWAPPGR